MRHRIHTAKLIRSGLLGLAIVWFAGSPVQAESPPDEPAQLPAEDWQVVQQPDLAKQLAEAPLLELAEVLPGPTRVWTEGPFFAPNPGGKTWDAILIYQKDYTRQKEVVIHDFGTGETHHQFLCNGEGDTPLTRDRYSFHIRPHYYANGKLFFEPGGPVMIVVYDPARNRFVHGAYPFGREVTNGAWALGEDGQLYGIGWSNDKSGLKSGFVPFRINTETLQAEAFKPFGPANPNRRSLYIECAMDGEWLYAGVGANPWHLVAYNFKTGEGRVLATTQPVIGDDNTIDLASMKGGIQGTIRQVAEVRGFEDVDREQFDCWLDEGRVYRRENDKPPWSDQPAELREPQYRWDKQVWFMGPRAHWGSFRPDPHPPEIDEDSMGPDSNGDVKLRYRLGDQEPWKTLRFTVDRYPGVTRRIMEIGKSRIFATDEGYGQAVIFDLARNEVQRLGDLESLSPYSMTTCDGRFYVSGYPSSRLYEFDPNRPVTLESVDPAASLQDVEKKPNPREVAVLGEHHGVHMPLATVAAADGRIYSGGTTVQRRRTGGGMAWYDTQTGESGGLWKPFSAYRIFWMATAAEGRYVLCSTKPTRDAINPDFTPEIGQIFCWDTEKGKFAYQVSPPGTFVPGPLAEALPGLMIGHTVTEDGKGRLYGFRADTGEVLWTKDVPVGPITAFSQARRHAWEFRRGPDGAIWTFLGRTLVRILPKNGRVEVVGRLPADAGPAQLAFVQGRVYLAGAFPLRRLGGVRTGH